MINSQQTAPDIQRQQRIAENFSHAASTYDNAASLQRRVARKAMLYLPAGFKPSRVLDLGSGTGSQTYRLAQGYPDAQIMGMDMALGMLYHAKRQFSRNKLSWCAGDIESLPFAPERFDLVFSNLAIQWCSSLSQVLHEVFQVLSPGGYFVFSTLARGSLGELAHAWRQVDGYRHVNEYSTLDVQIQKATDRGFHASALAQQPEVLFYTNLNELLKELRGLGVNTITENARPTMMSRRQLQRLHQAYEKFRQPAGLPLTYQVVYGLLQKPIG